MASLLVTNDFPPKLGGIQTYLHELWRRLPPAETTVLTTPYGGDRRFDAEQRFRIVRSRAAVLVPRPRLVRHIDALTRDLGVDVVFVDPLLPLGIVGPRLRGAPYVVVLHGAEVTVPGGLPGLRALTRHVLRHAAGVVAAGEYPARVAARVAGFPVRGLVVPPGVDVARFRPVARAERERARVGFGLDPAAPLVVGMSRLVPRKGFDVLIDAVAGLPGVRLAIGGAGRDRDRLEARVRHTGLERRVRFLGRVPHAELPALYASADVFAMPCRDRWGGLEAEGFGIVFLEAAASGVPAVAGRSGGSHEAVADGETGLVVDPRDVVALREAIGRLLDDDALRARLGAAARVRAEREFAYDSLVERLRPLAAGDLSVLEPL